MGKGNSKTTGRRAKCTKTLKQQINVIFYLDFVKPMSLPCSALFSNAIFNLSVGYE